MKKRVILTCVILVLSVAGITIFFSFCQGKKTYSIRTPGIVEGTEVNISSEISGTIQEICCREGDLVQEGAMVVKLRNEDLESLVDEAIAGVDRAKAEVKVAESAIESAKANLRSAEAEIRNAEAETDFLKTHYMDEAEALCSRVAIIDAGRIIAMGRFDHPRIVGVLSGFLNVILFFPSGAIYPVESFPSWLKAFAKVNPEAYAVKALKYELFKGADLKTVSLDIAFLAAFTLIMLTASIITFRRTL